MLDNNLFICVRKRPIKNKSVFDILECKNNDIILKENRVLVNLDKETKHHNFTFNKVYSEDILNYEIFDDIKHNINTNNNFICYTFGETGSGKTHTIFGDKYEKGILLETFEYLIDIYGKFNISAYELYGKYIYDILNKKTELEILEHNDKFYIKNLHIELCDENNIYKIFKDIYFGKTMGKSSQNKNSSRSHTIIKINIDNREIIFVDLAGSETAQKNNLINKKNSEEIAEINKSIFSLKECIRAIKVDSNHIPYRGSKLTMILKDSFRKNFKTMMINTLSPEETSFNETFNTLQYANDLMNIKIHIKLPPIKKEKRSHRSQSSLGDNIDSIYRELSIKEEMFYNKLVKTNDPILMTEYKKALLNILQRKHKIIN